MTRSDALKALDGALANGIERMFVILETSFAGNEIENAKAEKNFVAGIGFQLDAHAFASKVIIAKFKD